jgi:putative phosphoribosyl transferase
LHDLRIGLFGSSTGAAAALTTAASRPADIAAVVSRGGRVDLADLSLARVKAASLFLVGSGDLEVLELNRAAAARLQCVHQLVVVPGATHLFEEHGTLEEVARLAGDWFLRHLC